MAACPTVSSGGAFLSTLLQHIDCQGRSIGAIGYQALADPASPTSILLTGLLTIFVALFGLRMVLGETPSVRDGVLAVLRIGVVLLIATSWPAYRTVVYDVVVKGPAQLSAVLAGRSALPGVNGDLVPRVQVADNAITRLTTLGGGRNDLSSTPAIGPDGRALSVERAPLADDLAFGSARVMFLSGIVAAFAVVRLGAGVLLALAPLFAGLILFDIGRGLFVGWARALVFTFLASIAATLIVGVELAVLEPWLNQALRLRHARVVTPEVPVELLVMCLGFTLALVGSLAVLLRLSFMIDLRLVSGAPRADTVAEPGRTPVQARASGRLSSERPTRAAELAGAVAAAQRREAAGRATAAFAGRTMSLSPAAAAAGAGRAGGAITSGAARRTRPRKSRASALRDRSS